MLSEHPKAGGETAEDDALDFIDWCTRTRLEELEVRSFGLLGDRARTFRSIELVEVLLLHHFYFFGFRIVNMYWLRQILLREDEQVLSVIGELDQSVLGPRALVPGGDTMVVFDALYRLLIQLTDCLRIQLDVFVSFVYFVLAAQVFALLVPQEVNAQAFFRLVL